VRVLIVARGYPSEAYKMNGIFEFDQAKALQASGVEVIYAAIDIRSIRRWRKWGIERKVVDGVKVYSINIPCGKLPILILNKVRTLALKKLFKFIIKFEDKPDLIHAHFIVNGYAVAELFCNEDIPLLLTEHFSAMNNENLSRSLIKVGENTYSRMDSVICVSSALAQKIKKNFNVEAVVIPNVVDMEKFSYKPIDNNNFIFISTGRLVENKGMDFLIKCFRRAFHEEENVLLYIFGDGPQRKELEELIAVQGLQDKVILYGLVDRNIIANNMKSGHCFVLASKQETFGLSYVEALASGLPVISTKCGGPEGFVNEKNGVMVEIDNEKELIDALKYMYNYSHDIYNSVEIATEARERFSAEAVSRELINLYRKYLS